MIDDSVARLAACTHTGDRTSRRKRKRREEGKGGGEGRRRREEEKVHSYRSLKGK